MGKLFSGVINTWSSTEPRLLFNATGGGTDGKLYDLDVTPTLISLRTRTDADGAGVTILSATRTAASTAITNVTIGVASVAGTYTFPFTGSATFSGAITASSTITAPRVAVNNSTAPVIGMYSGGGSRLSFAVGSTLRGEFDASGNFVTSFATADVSFVKITPTTGFSQTIANNTTTLLIVPAGTLATGTVTMPSTPINGQVVRFSTSQLITSLTLSPNSGQSIVGAPTTLALGQGAAFIYVTADTTWYRLYLGN